MRFPWSPKPLPPPKYAGHLQKLPVIGNGVEKGQELWVITNENGTVVSSWKTLERSIEAVPDGVSLKKITFSEYILYTGVGKDGCV